MKLGLITIELKLNNYDKQGNEEERDLPKGKKVKKKLKKER